MAGDTSGVLELATNGSTTAVTISTAQNVGIGNTGPSNKLDVTGAKANADNDSLGQMIVRDTTAYNSTPIAGIQFALKYNTAGTYAVGTSIQGFKENATDGNFAQALRFTTQANGDSPKERMRIDSSGNLQVGSTTGPAKINTFQASNGQCINMGDGNAFDSSFYGVTQITRAPNPGDNRFHLGFVRNGNQIAGIGFLNNSNTLFVGNSSATNANGMLLTVNATSWGSQSDERVKNIHGNIENAVEKIGEWRTVYFNYKIDEEGSKQRVGLIAQDVEKTAPEVVDSIGDEQDTLQVRYTEVIPFLVKAIQEQQTIINDLKARITALEGAA
jgi:hypothetical protein